MMNGAAMSQKYAAGNGNYSYTNGQPSDKSGQRNENGVDHWQQNPAYTAKLTFDTGKGMDEEFATSVV